MDRPPSFWPARRHARYLASLWQRPNPERAAPLKTLPAAKREVTRAPGYLRPDDFLAMFRYVREKAYESKSFRDFVKSLPS